ncbi:hypothetical protein QEN19_003814 [Hanseniaspora menglaensis]
MKMSFFVIFLMIIGVSLFFLHEITDQLISVRAHDYVHGALMFIGFYEWPSNSFNQRHPLTSKYAKEIRTLFNVMNKLQEEAIETKLEIDANENKEDNGVKLHYGTLMTNRLFDHKYKPFEDIFNERTLEAIDNKMPYDLNPNLYWDVLLSQAIDIENHKIKNTDFSGDIEFSWYDFVDNYDYNILLKLSQEEGTTVNCQATNFVCIPKELVDLSDFESEEQVSIAEEQDSNENVNDENQVSSSKIKGIFVKDLMIQYNSPIFLEKNKNSHYDPHQFCIDELSRLETYYNSSRAHLKYTDNYLFPLLQVKLNSKVRAEVFGLQTVAKLFNVDKNPLGLIILKTDTQNNFNSQFKFYPVKDTQHERKPLMGQNFVTLGTIDKYRDQITLEKENLLYKFDQIPFNSLKNENIVKDGETLLDSIFEFNVTEKIIEMESKIESLSKVQVNYLNSLIFNSQRHYSQNNKHFNEPSEILQLKGRGNHYNTEFFHSGRFEKHPQLKQASIHNLVQTLSSLIAAYGLNGWISHGNLLAWSYNGVNFPWDEDVDYQMPLKDLHKLAEHCNQTLILQDPQHGNGRYWLDVGNLLGRTNGNGLNNIDARLVDVDTGLYIDITGLCYNSEVVSEKNYNDLREFFTEHRTNYSSLVLEKDPNLSEIDRIPTQDYLNIINDQLANKRIVKNESIRKCSATIKNEQKFKKSISSLNPKISIDDEDFEITEQVNELVNLYLTNMTMDERYSINKQLKLVTCRNRHFTPIDWLTRLQPTFFQRISVKVPIGYINMLSKEYGNIDSEKHAFDTFMIYQRYIYIPIYKTWLQAKYFTASLKLPHKLISSNGFDEDNTIDLSQENVDTLSLEASELLLANMCDVNKSEMNSIMVISDMIEQMDQKEYRTSELQLEISEDFSTNSFDNQFEFGLQTFASSSNFFIDPYKLNLIYKDYYNLERPYEQEVCLKYVFKLIKTIEDSHFI